MYQEYLRQVEGPEGQPDPFLNESIYHYGTCWSIKLNSDDPLPKGVKSLETIRFGGHALGTLLRTGGFMYKDEEQEWVMQEFEIPNIDDLPREFTESIHLVNSYRNIVPNIVKELKVPGSYLLPPQKEQWTVSVTIRKDEVIWSARSNLTGEIFRGKTFNFLLYRGVSLETVMNQIMSSITHQIPIEAIDSLDRLRSNLMRDLRELGYHSKNQCEITLTREGRDIKVVVRSDSLIRHMKFGSIVVRDDWTIRDVWRKLMEILDEVQLAEHEIANEEELETDLNQLMREIAAENDMEHKFTPIGLMGDEFKSQRTNPLMIQLKFSKLGMEIQQHLDEGRFTDALKVMDECIRLLESSDVKGSLLNSWFLVRMLALKVKTLSKEEAKGTVSPQRLLGLLNRMHDAIPDMYRIKSLRKDQSELVLWALALRERLREVV